VLQKFGTFEFGIGEFSVTSDCTIHMYSTHSEGAVVNVSNIKKNCVPLHPSGMYTYRHIEH